MKDHAFDRVRTIAGIILMVGGLAALIFAGLNNFASLPLTLAGALFALSGVLIAFSHKLAQLFVQR